MFRNFILFISCIFMFSLVFTDVTHAELVGWWRLDEGTGNIAYDSSGNSIDGVLEGAAAIVNDAERGPVFQQNDVAADYISIADPAGLLNFSGTGPHQGSATIAAWVKNNNGAGWTNHDTIFSQGEWDDGISLAIKGDTSPPGQLWLAGDGTHAVTFRSDVAVPLDGWHHVAATFDYDGTKTVITLYMDGEPTGFAQGDGNVPGRVTAPVGGISRIGLENRNGSAPRWPFNGSIDNVMIFDTALSQEELQAVMQGGGTAYPLASRPGPSDGALYENTWVSVSWQQGDFAASHDVYFGDNFDDVNDGTRDSEVFRGNQDLDTTFYFAGFPPGAYPDGLVNGVTYYWRIDEVNDSDPNSPWKGKVWSFTVPPKTAYNPVPSEGAEFVALNVRLTWTAGLGAKIHYVVFGEDFDEVSDAAGTKIGATSYSPGPLKMAKTYYWRVDESDGFNTYKGLVWSFTTKGAVSGPNPANGAADVNPAQVLTWDAGAVAASHEVYFGTDADAVKNATNASPEYKGPKALGQESYDPGKLTLNTTYYWRIDEVNSANPDGPWAGNVWSFTTGNYFVIDDFEIYDANDNQIWYAWHDGLGAGTPGSPGYLAGNGTGSAVGNESTPSYTEETIIHGGGRSMPIVFDNNKQGFSMYSEVELTLTDQRDWTAEGVAELSLWFRGNAASVGGFVEGPLGTYTITGSGADIWNPSDAFHYAYKTLTGAGSIVAKVESVGSTHSWAKAGVMIRETLDAGSRHAMMVVTPASGVSFQRRPDTDGASQSDTTGGITTPYWVKIERDLAGNFSAYSSADGATWQKQGLSVPIQMSTNVYIGLAVTAHNASAACEAVFTNVTTTGNAGVQWASQDVGIESNDAEPLYIAVSNIGGVSAVVVHENPAAANINTWTEWVIPLSAFADQGIDLTDVTSIAIGLGTRGNITVPGGSGKMYIDDIRLYRSREAAE